MSKYKVTLRDIGDGIGASTHDIEADRVVYGGQWVEFHPAPDAQRNVDLPLAKACFATQFVVAVEEVPE